MWKRIQANDKYNESQSAFVVVAVAIVVYIYSISGMEEEFNLNDFRKL